MRGDHDERPEPHPFVIFFAVAAVFVVALVIISRVAGAKEDNVLLDQPAAIDLAASQGGDTPAEQVVQAAEAAVPSEAAAPAETAPAEEVAPAEVAPAIEAPAVELAAAPAILPAMTPSSPQPRVSAEAFAIVDRSCGALAYGKNEHQRLAPASLTKIMTALVTEQQVSQDAMVDVHVSGSQMARRGSSVMGIEPGMLVSVRDLLYGLFLPSGNDAAMALAAHIGGGEVGRFVDMMNAQAASLQLQDTHFANPHGLDDANLYSSAFDMAIAGRAVLDDPELAAISSAPAYRTAGDGLAMKNGNKLLSLYPGSFGVKIGYTSRANQTIVAAAERDGRQVIVSVFGSDDRYGDAIALFNWAFSSIPSRCS